MLRIRPFVLVAALFASSLACEDTLDPASDLEMIEAERSETGTSWWMRVVEDKYDVAFVDGPELNVVIDPAALPKDIAGVGTAEALIEIAGTNGQPFKVKLKIAVMPAAPPAE